MAMRKLTMMLAAASTACIVAFGQEGSGQAASQIVVTNLSDQL